MRKNKLKRFQILITEDQYNWLRLISYQKAQSIASILRDILEGVRKNG